MGLIIRIQAQGSQSQVDLKAEQLKRAIGEVVRGLVGTNVDIDLVIQNDDGFANRVKGFMEDQR